MNSNSSEESSNSPVVYSDEDEPTIHPEEVADEEVADEEVADPKNELYDSFKGVNKIPTGKIIIEKYLASGSFGHIFRGSWDTLPVALKKK